jgi:hypothetical protein
MKPFQTLLDIFSKIERKIETLPKPFLSFFKVFLRTLPNPSKNSRSNKTLPNPSFSLEGFQTQNFPKTLPLLSLLYRERGKGWVGI